MREVITILNIFLLMILIFTLFCLREATVYTRNAVILTFTLIFSLFLALFFKVKRYKIFAATAAYVFTSIII